MQTIFEICHPRPEVLKGELREDIFAARLKDVIDGNADPVYQQPTIFFDNTYPTAGLKLLLSEVMGRLTGVKAANNAIVRLETAFGGGKTHNLIALYHVANGHAPDPALLGPALIPTAGAVNVVGVVGSDLQPRDGLDHGDAVTYTLWGEIAYQLSGPSGYAEVAGSDQDRSAPGTGFLEKLAGDAPTLIMLDEVARHLRAAKTVPTITGKSDLAEQTVAFLMSLFEFAASRKQVVVVLTLADSKDAFGNETNELRQELAEAKRLSARQERVITPTGEAEISAIVTHRLFRQVDSGVAQTVSEAYSNTYHRLLAQGANLPQRAIRAEYAEEMVSDYPFHPELLTTLNRKTSTIPNFQKTRGALRLLAAVIRRLWEAKPAHTYLIHPHHLDLAVAGIADDLTSRLDRPAFKQVIEADIVSPKLGSRAHAQTIDAYWLDAGKPAYASHVASTVFLHSLSQGIATGVDPADLTLAVLTPGDDPALVNKATERLVDTCWFFDWDGHRYRFKTEPALNKIIADEMGMVGTVKAKAELDHRIRQVWKTGHLKPVYFASEAGDADDDADKPKLVIMHYDAVTSTATAAKPADLVQRVFDRAGSLEGYRTYKNNVLFLVADKEQVDNMVEVAQRYLAIGRIVGDPSRMQEFNEEQRKRLKKMAEAAELQVRVSITKAYRYLYYPSAEAPRSHSNLARETLPAQDQGEVNKDQTNVVLKVLKLLQKVLTADDATLSAQYVRAKAWDSGQQSISTEGLRRAFARRLGLRILLDLNQLKNTVRNGIKQNTWVYYNSGEQLGYDSDTPPPLIQISDDVLLYTPEEAARLDLPIKGKEKSAGPGGGGGQETTCPVCGNLESQCTCIDDDGDDVVTLRLHADGAPAQAFQSLLDQCHDQQVSRLARLTISLEGSGKNGADEARSLGLAIPQMGKGTFAVEQTFNAEFGPEMLSVKFSGGWDRYKRLKQVTDAFGQEASKLFVRTTLQIDFDGGLNVNADQFQTMHEVFTALSFGRIVLDAEPLEAQS